MFALEKMVRPSTLFLRVLMWLTVNGLAAAAAERERGYPGYSIVWLSIIVIGLFFKFRTILEFLEIPCHCQKETNIRVRESKSLSFSIIISCPPINQSTTDVLYRYRTRIYLFLIGHGPATLLDVAWSYTR